MNQIPTKICRICNEEKELDCFGKNKRTQDQHHYYCKDCVINIRAANKEKDKQYFKDYRENHMQKLNKYQKEYRSKKSVLADISLCASDDEIITNAQHKRDQEKARRKNEEYKSKRRDYFRNKYRTDEQFRLKKLFESKLNRMLKYNDATDKCIQLIGCTIPEFKAHVAAQFVATMSWSNYGSEWNLDRIAPYCDHNLTDAEEAKKCFYYSNVQPLFIQTKIIDGVEYVGNMNKNKY